MRRHVAPTPALAVHRRREYDGRMSATHELAVTECQDRLEVAGRVVRRHFWRRLLPALGVTSYMAVSAAVGLGTPAAIMAGVFGLFAGREAVRFRKNLTRLRDLEGELASLGRPSDLATRHYDELRSNLDD